MTLVLINVRVVLNEFLVVGLRVISENRETGENYELFIYCFFSRRRMSRK